MRTVLHESKSPQKTTDQLRRLNQGRLLLLLGHIKDILNHTNYYYVKKGKGIFRAPYNNKLVDMNDDITEHIHKMIDRLTSKHNIDCTPDYYIVNIVSGECNCFDFIWNGPFRDACKHVHAARIYNNIKNDIDTEKEIIRANLVTHFKNREKVLSANMKNNIIYSGSVNSAFAEILRSFEKYGHEIFYPCVRDIVDSDPFRPRK